MARNRALDALEDDFLICRVIKHSWDNNPTAELETVFSRVIALRCIHCHSERFDYLNIHGALMQRYYRYSTGYKRISRVPLEVLRRELMRRNVLVQLTRGVRITDDEDVVVPMRRRKAHSG